MKVDDIFLENAKKKEDVCRYLDENSLFLYFGDKIELNSKAREYFDSRLEQNKVIEVYRFIEILKIDKAFRNVGINPVFFKGSLLARILYEDKHYLRMAGDIDLWVNPENFDGALNILYELGYVLDYEETLFDEHHIMMENGKFLVELHHNIIDPRMGIDETYLLSNIVEFEANNHKLLTFSLSATLLHLIYHIYADIIMNTGFRGFYVNGKILDLPERFDYRAYDIVRFIELYNDKILWEDLIDDIRNQNLDVIFYCFIRYINDIYDVFPESFIFEVKNKCCVYNSENKAILNYLGFLRSSKEFIISEPLVSYLDIIWSGMYMNAGRERRSLCVNEFDSKKISNKDSYIIQGKQPSSEKDLSFKLDYWSDEECLWLEIKVKDDAVIFADEKFNSYGCDCIGLILVDTNPYIFKQIFIFPLKEDEHISGVVMNMNKKERITDGTVKAKVTLNDDGYTALVCISRKLFSLNSYTYFDLLVCDCDENGGEKKTTMNVFGNPYDWRDVSKFSRICFS